MASGRVWRVLGEWMGRRWFIVVPVGLAIVVMLPTLGMGWQMDDLGHRSMLLPSDRVPEEYVRMHDLPEGNERLGWAMQNLFAFMRPEENLDKLVDYGYWPWWSHPELRGAFWRPVSSFTLWLDYQLWPDSGPAQHAHSILWFAAAVLLVSLLYRKLIGPVWAAGLAAVFYALDESFYNPVMMMANRNSLIAVVFGMLCFRAHIRWREQKGAVYGGLAVLALAVSLLAAEAGLATAAFLFAYAVTLDKAGWKRGVLSLLPYVVLVILWRVVYNVQGYGTYAVSIYSDPVREPLLYLKEIFLRGPVYMFAQWFGVESSGYHFCAGWTKGLFWGIAAGLTVLLGAGLYPMVKRDRTVRFWLIAMVLALLPICATSPMNRNLVFVGIAAMALCALFVKGVLSGERALLASRPRRILSWGLCGIFLFAQLVSAGCAHLVQPYITKKFFAYMTPRVDMGPDEDIEKHDLVVVGAKDHISVLGFSLRRVVENRPMPRHVRNLVPAVAPLAVERVDERTLAIRSRRGSLFTAPVDSSRLALHPVYFLELFNDLFRAEQFGFEPGERIELPGMTVEIKAVNEKGRPTEAWYRFDKSLEDPTLRWFGWDWSVRKYLPFKVPAAGETVELPWVE